MSLPAPPPPGATDTVGDEAGFGFCFETKNLNAAHKPPTTTTTPPPIHESTVRLASSCKKAQMLSMTSPQRDSVSFVLFFEIHNPACAHAVGPLSSLVFESDSGGAFFLIYA